MKQTLALLILLISMGLSEQCTIYSQASPPKDTLVSLTTEQVRSLLKLKAERDYLFNAVNICTKSDSIKGKVITDQAKSIDAWAITNEKTAQQLVKAQEDLYNYKDIINLARIALSQGEYHYGMIDPYNSLKIDLSGYSKLNTHEYHYEALSELKSYGQKNKFGWFITHHAVTAALRLKDADKKYPVAPRKEDTEQGGKVANKADDFLTIHRITQHPTDWMISEIHVRKIKDTETGGRPTILELPIRFERYKGGYAYVEVDEFRVRGVDPVEEWHKKNGTAQDLNFYVEPKQNWQPFKDSTDIGF